jgi:acetate CoA/acetoacetate CoA-transferase alpha subunit
MKSVISAAQAAARIPDGAVLMIGGFMGVGSPHRMIDALVECGRGSFTVIANDSARPGIGIGKLIDGRRIRRLVVSHIGTNPETQRQMITGEIEVELVPQGTLAERVRAGGFGLGGILTKTGLGTPVEDGKPTFAVDGETWLVERPLRADFALVAAKQADYVGNLCYQLTAQNFNPIMAMAADIVIAEAEEIVAVGIVPPDMVRTPGVLVDAMLRGDASARDLQGAVATAERAAPATGAARSQQ